MAVWNVIGPKMGYFKIIMAQYNLNASLFFYWPIMLNFMKVFSSQKAFQEDDVYTIFYFFKK